LFSGDQLTAEELSKQLTADQLPTDSAIAAAAAAFAAAATNGTDPPNGPATRFFDDLRKYSTEEPR